MQYIPSHKELERRYHSANATQVMRDYWLSKLEARANNGSKECKAIVAKIKGGLQ